MAELESVRIAVFVDGGYWDAIVAFHRHHPDRPGPHSLRGLLGGLPALIAELLEIDEKRCWITEKHYFRGYLGTHMLEERGFFRQQSELHDELLGLAVVPHYRPMNGNAEEKGTDVDLALEAYAAVTERHTDIAVLVTGDSDFVPLVERIQREGGRVVLLAWDFQYLDASGRLHETRTSVRLARTAWRPVRMDGSYTSRALDAHSARRSLVTTRDQRPAPVSTATPAAVSADTLAGFGGRGLRRGWIESLKGGRYGFVHDIALEGTWFFHRNGLSGVTFEELRPGLMVEFAVGRNHNGPMAVGVRVLDSQTLPVAS